MDDPQPMSPWEWLRSGGEFVGKGAESVMPDRCLDAFLCFIDLHPTCVTIPCIHSLKCGAGDPD